MRAWDTVLLAIAVIVLSITQIMTTKDVRQLQARIDSTEAAMTLQNVALQLSIKGGLELVYAMQRLHPEDTLSYEPAEPHTEVDSLNFQALSAP